MNQQFPESFVRPSVVEMKVIKLIVMRSGTYQPMVYRPYKTTWNVEVADDLARRLHDNGPGQSTHTSLMAGIANRIMMPMHQHEGQVPIVNGWDHVRGRFNMVLWVRHTTGTEFYYHIQGYTSHYDLTIQGTPDPSIEFYVNSYVRLSRNAIHTSLGIETRDIVTESAQVINGRLIKNQLGQDIYGMRPNELYSVMQAGQIAADIYQTELQDNIKDNRHVLSYHNVPSHRTNNMPANLLARMVQSYQTGTQLTEYGQDRSDLYTRSKGYAYEGALMENAFFRQLANITGTPEATSFRMNDLLKIDPHVTHPEVTTFITLSANALAKVNSAGQSQYWHDPNDRLAWACTVLCNAVPTIMMEMMITKLWFTANNYDHMGINRVDIGGARDLMARDISTSLEAFKHRFVHEVMNDLTFNNQETYSLTMMIDLNGDTVIDITMGAQPMTRYVMPSFCDSLTTPIITTSHNLLQDNVHDFTHILRSVTDVAQGTLINETV